MEQRAVSVWFKNTFIRNIGILKPKLSTSNQHKFTKKMHFIDKIACFTDNRLVVSEITYTLHLS